MFLYLWNTSLVGNSQVLCFFLVLDIVLNIKTCIFDVIHRSTHFYCIPDRFSDSSITIPSTDQFGVENTSSIMFSSSTVTPPHSLLLLSQYARRAHQWSQHFYTKKWWSNHTVAVWNSLTGQVYQKHARCYTYKIKAIISQYCGTNFQQTGQQHLGTNFWP